MIMRLFAYKIHFNKMFESDSGCRAILCCGNCPTEKAGRLRPPAPHVTHSSPQPGIRTTRNAPHISTKPLWRCSLEENTAHSQPGWDHQVDEAGRGGRVSQHRPQADCSPAGYPHRQVWTESGFEPELWLRETDGNPTAHLHSSGVPVWSWGVPIGQPARGFGLRPPLSPASDSGVLVQRVQEWTSQTLKVGQVRGLCLEIK